MTLATKLEAYIEGLTLSQGRYAGQLFKLLPREKRFLRGAFREGVGDAALSKRSGAALPNRQPLPICPIGT